MPEEMIDVELRLGKEQANELLKLTKPELMNRLVVMILRNHVQDEAINNLEKENTRVKGMLDKAETYIEQARGMINSLMEKWYHYDL